MLVEGKIFAYKKKIEKLFETAGEILGEDFSKVNISLNFVSGDEIKNLNNQFRKIDKVTDVLSFPNLNKAYSQKLTEFDSERNPDDGMLFLGDVVICKKVAKSQAKEYGHGAKREICFLALHGLLHLLGYDHIKEEEEKNMKETAEKILQAFGVTR